MEKIIHGGPSIRPASIVPGLAQLRYPRTGAISGPHRSEHVQEWLTSYALVSSWQIDLDRRAVDEVGMWEGVENRLGDPRLVGWCAGSV